MNIQCRSGLLELCVLSILSRKECYGFELVEEISERVKIAKGTIYPTMRRLVKDGSVTSYFREVDDRPKRKYYTLTGSGRERLQNLETEWERLIYGVNYIVGGGIECEEKNL